MHGFEKLFMVRNGDPAGTIGETILGRVGALRRTAKETTTLAALTQPLLGLGQYCNSGRTLGQIQLMITPVDFYKRP